MAHPAPSTRDIPSLSNSLRRKLTAARDADTTLSGSQSDGGADPFAGIVQSEELWALLDLIDQNPPSQSQDGARPGPSAESGSHTLDAIDQSMAQWQAQISTAFSQVAVRELAEHLQAAERITRSLTDQQNLLAEQRKTVEQQLADLLKRESRLSRQRKSVAHMLRGRKSEALLQIERRRDELQAEALRQCQSQQAELHAAQLARLREELSQQKSAGEQTQQQLDDALAAQQRVQEELESLRAAAASQEKQQSGENHQIEKLEQDLAEARQELELVLEELNSQSRPSAEAVEKATELEQQLKNAQQDKERANQQIAALQEELATRPVDAEKEHDDGGRLAALEEELQDLRQQNSDLAAQVAKHQVASKGQVPHASFDQESLSWEERKKLIMRQLESEGDDASAPPEQVAHRVAVEEVLASTQAEIDRRDREIKELQSIIEQQSDTKQGVAIGAAAIAQAFESDELIQQERQKLKEIQREWEEKLRQAEIDLSMERAKLARERLQLESQRSESPPDASPANDNLPKKRKWLEHLGLKEENRESK